MEKETFQLNLTMVSGDVLMIIPCEEASHSAELVTDGENDISLKFKTYEKNNKVILGETNSNFVFLGKYKGKESTKNILQYESYLKEYNFNPDECFLVLKKYKDENH